MRDLYSDDYESVAVGDADRLIPEGVRRLAGAAVFLGLIAVLGLWSYRLGTRDASQVPIIKAMDGPTRIQPEDPGGLQAAHQGLEVNEVLGGSPATMPKDIPPARPEPKALAAEDAPQGELVASAPAVLAQRVLGESGDLPPVDDTAAPVPGTPDVALLPDAAGEVLGAVEAEAKPDLEADPDATANDDADTLADVRPRNRPAGLAMSHANAKTTQVASPGPAAAVKVAAAEPEPTPKPTPVKVSATATVPAPAPAVREVSGLPVGTRLVQLGAFDSEAITRKAWAQLVARNGDLLGSKSLYVERTTANARVFYRLRVAGFQSANETRQLCEGLRSRGVACIPVTLQ